MRKLLFIAGAIIVSSFFLPPRIDYFTFAEGATLSFSPENGVYTVGKTFAVKVVVSSNQKTINAADGVITFDHQLLSVASVSKDGSVFSLWAVEPGFSNAEGTVKFGGGNTVPFNGTNGTVVKVTFKALKAGTAELAFSSGSILAADGKGTNVLGGFGKGTYTLKEAATEQAPKATTPQSTPLPVAATPLPSPAAPLPPQEVASPTHADPDRWYSNNNPEFSWKLSPDIVGESMLLSKNPGEDPGPIQATLVESQTYKSAPEGEWYFHLKVQDKDGASSLTHRKVLIDVTPPKPFAIEVHSEDPADPRPQLFFDTSDEMSGLKNYEIQIGTGDPFTMTVEDFKRQVLLDQVGDPVKPFPYRMPLQSPGSHPVRVKAIDFAGNNSVAEKDVVVASLEAPTIAAFPLIKREGSVLLLEGSTLPDSTVILRLQRNDDKPVQEEIRSSGKLTWLYVKKSIEQGHYKAMVRTIDARGAESPFSEAINFRVVSPSIVERFGWFMVAVLGAGILGLLALAWHRKRFAREHMAVVKKELGDMREQTKRIFDALHEEVEERVRILTDKPSFNESDHALEVLNADLETSQELIDKEIQVVEKTVSR